MKPFDLTASGADKWFNCPGSINAEERIEEEYTEFLSERALAHLLAEVSLNSGYPASTYEELNDQEISVKMEGYVQDYIYYVLSYTSYRDKLTVGSKVSFDDYAPGGFGTLDASVMNYAEGTCHIFYLEYGSDTPVYAKDNTQMMLYALGMLQSADYAWRIERFVMHVHQPRIQNISSFEISVGKLKEFGEVVRVKASEALNPNAKRVPGLEQCGGCKAKSICPEFHSER